LGRGLPAGYAIDLPFTDCGTVPFEGSDCVADVRE